MCEMKLSRDAPMINLLEDVHVALEAKAFYLALMGALALPDICASMEHADGIATGARYAAWFDKWLGQKYSDFLSGSECYSFRCALLHQGATGQARRGYARVLFLLPGATRHIMHMNIVGDALNLDLVKFCTDVTSAVHEWLTAVEGTEPYITNLGRIIRVHPNGLRPYIVGMPVIA
jgi:hypothetical protein